MKRLLLLADDPLLASFHRENLQNLGDGVVIETVQDVQSAVRSLARHPADLVLLDPVLPTGGNISETVKAVHESAARKPILLLPAHSSILSGDTAAATDGMKILSRTGRETLAQEVAREASAALGFTAKNSAMQPGEYRAPVPAAWVKACMEEVPEAIKSLRLSTHTFLKDSRRLDVLGALFRQIHQLSERTAMIDLLSIHKLTGALEGLVYDLHAKPEEINPSVLRTVTQTIDLLAVLFDPKNVGRVQDLTRADVFLVEDEPQARKLISAAMQRVNVRITCAADSGMAMSVLEDNVFDLIFLDVNLPEGSGFDLCRKVRELEDHARTPIVFVTGLSSLKNRAESSLCGGNDFVAKPFNVLELGVKALTWILKGQLARA